MRLGERQTILVPSPLYPGERGRGEGVWIRPQAPSPPLSPEYGGEGRPFPSARLYPSSSSASLPWGKDVINTDGEIGQEGRSGHRPPTEFAMNPIRPAFQHQNRDA